MQNCALVGKDDSMRLIYHNLGKKNESNNESPFLNALLEIFKNNDVKMTCPYIDRKYLTILQGEANDIKIISYILAWLKSCSNINERKKTLKLMENLGAKLHHCDNLHSKVFFSNKIALLGSANLTVSGMRRNMEMSVFIKDLKLIEKLNSWFDDIWNKTNRIDYTDFNKLGKWIKNDSRKEKTTEGKRIKLNIDSPNIMAKTPGKLKSISYLVENVSAEILEIAELFPSKKWLKEFFEVWSNIIDYFKIKGDDERVTLNIRNTKDRFAMIIGQRYVVTAYYNGIIALIMPVDSKIYNEDKPLVKQEEFTSNGEIVCYLNYFKTDNPKEVFFRYRDNVLTCIKDELKRTKVSGYRKHNKKELYLIASKEERCKEFLNNSFRTLD